MRADNKKIENIKNILVTRLEESRRAMLGQIQNKFRTEVRDLKELDKKITEVRKKIEKKLPLGYGISGHEIYVASHYSDDIIPEEDLTALRRINELNVIGKTEEAQKELCKLMKKYRVGE